MKGEFRNRQLAVGSWQLANIFIEEMTAEWSLDG
jgi:hypothetical protein